MDSRKVDYEVHYSEGLIFFQCLCDMEEAELKEYLVFAFNDEPAAYSFDWLVDFSEILSALSTEKLREIGRAWQRMAKGRDVGKRTAYITQDPLMREQLLLSTSSLQYRTIRSFGCLDEALQWLRTIDDDREGRGVQAV